MTLADARWVVRYKHLLFQCYMQSTLHSTLQKSYACISLVCDILKLILKPSTSLNLCRRHELRMQEIVLMITSNGN
ncbi:hypothetical protein TWF751_004547 [Orbilia oligospora]|nr:hypothetical protein TWF751_004547 [Orbilia oligospora]KAF3265162.1 hypothetical protein TWF128_000455 [Orbilia oligospora]